MPLLNQSKLKRICIVRPMLYGAAFKEFCTSPNIAENLQRLEIEHFFAAGNESRGLVAVPAVDYASSFLALRHLRCLQLRRVLNLDTLLPHLVHAASLTELILESSVENAWAAQGLLPSTDVIYSLLSACERLHVRLLVHSSPTKWNARTIAATGAAMRYECTRMAREFRFFGPRFSTPHE
jgi:hypothetical protein